MDKSPCAGCRNVDVPGKALSDDNCITACEKHARNIFVTTSEKELELIQLMYYIVEKRGGATSKVDIYYRCCGIRFEKGTLVARQKEIVRVNHHALAAERYSYHNTDGTLGGFRNVDLYDGQLIKRHISVQEADRTLRDRYSHHGNDLEISREDFSSGKSFLYKLRALFD